MFGLKTRIYADTAASTPIDKKVERVLLRSIKTLYGNPSSLHQEGVVANKKLEESRLFVADFLQARPSEVIFTSGGTESNSLAIKGFCDAFVEKNKSLKFKPRIIVGAIEHSSVIESAKACQNFGCEVVLAPVDSEGRLILDDFKKLLTPETILVSIGLVNNEIGVIEDIREIASIIRRFKKQNNISYPYFHTDACQAPRFLNLNVKNLGVDLLTINSSKIYGPKGVGVLYIKSGMELLAILNGGGQESGLRSGTQNVPSIIAFTEALKLCQQKRDQESIKLTTLRDFLFKEISSQIPDSFFYGPLVNRIPNNINIGFKNVKAEDLVIGLDVLGVSASAGSACSSREKDQSHVLKALGVSDGQTSIRLTLGRDTNLSDIKKIVIRLKKVTDRIRRSQALFI